MALQLRVKKGHHRKRCSPLENDIAGFSNRYKPHHRHSFAGFFDLAFHKHGHHRKDSNGTSLTHDLTIDNEELYSGEETTSIKPNEDVHGLYLSPLHMIQHGKSVSESFDDHSPLSEAIEKTLDDKEEAESECSSLQGLNCIVEESSRENGSFLSVGLSSSEEEELESVCLYLEELSCIIEESSKESKLDDSNRFPRGEGTAVTQQQEELDSVCLSVEDHSFFIEETSKESKPAYSNRFPREEGTAVTHQQQIMAKIQRQQQRMQQQQEHLNSPELVDMINTLVAQNEILVSELQNAVTDLADAQAKANSTSSSPLSSHGHDVPFLVDQFLQKTQDSDRQQPRVGSCTNSSSQMNAVAPRMMQMDGSFLSLYGGSWTPFSSDPFSTQTQAQANPTPSSPLSSHCDEESSHHHSSSQMVAVATRMVQMEGSFLSLNENSWTPFNIDPFSLRDFVWNRIRRSIKYKSLKEDKPSQNESAPLLRTNKNSLNKIDLSSHIGICGGKDSNFVHLLDQEETCSSSSCSSTSEVSSDRKELLKRSIQPIKKTRRRSSRRLRSFFSRPMTNPDPLPTEENSPASVLDITFSEQGVEQVLVNSGEVQCWTLADGTTRMEV